MESGVQNRPSKQYRQLIDNPLNRGTVKVKTCILDCGPRGLGNNVESTDTCAACWEVEFFLCRDTRLRWLTCVHAIRSFTELLSEHIVTFLLDNACQTMPSLIKGQSDTIFHYLQYTYSVVQKGESLASYGRLFEMSNDKKSFSSLKFQETYPLSVKLISNWRRLAFV